jgi:hypothetical protein
MEKLWNKEIEKRFFTASFESFTPEELFYVTKDDRHIAYWPKDYKGKKYTLQSRNAPIGDFTEKWTTNLIQEIVKDKGLFADVVISRKKNIIQEPEDIIVIIEVKMSIVWNWELKNKELVCIGDYKTHKGTPGLLRSDTMLKAGGKSINIKVSSPKVSTIPIIVMGNTPVKSSYYSKVDMLKETGVIQGFWSVNPKPLDNDEENIKKTAKQGFYRFDSFDELGKSFETLLSEERNFFSSMKSKKELGKIIEVANREETYEKKAEVFFKLIKE